MMDDRIRQLLLQLLFYHPKAVYNGMRGPTCD